MKMDDTTPTPNRATAINVRRTATLYRITGCLFALAGLVGAAGHDGGLAATYLALCALFLLLGRKKAREARNLENANTTPRPGRGLR